MSCQRRVVVGRVVVERVVVERVVVEKVVSERVVVRLPERRKERRKEGLGVYIGLYSICAKKFSPPAKVCSAGGHCIYGV